MDSYTFTKINLWKRCCFGVVCLSIGIVTLATGVCGCVCEDGRCTGGQRVALQQSRGRRFVGFNLLQSESE